MKASKHEMLFCRIQLLPVLSRELMPAGVTPCECTQHTAVSAHRETRRAAAGKADNGGFPSKVPTVNTPQSLFPTFDLSILSIMPPF